MQQLAIAILLQAAFQIWKEKEDHLRQVFVDTLLHNIEDEVINLVIDELTATRH